MLFSHQLRRIGSGVAFLGVLLAATAGQAEDVEELIKQGVALRKRGDDVKAHGYFQRAYEVAHTPRCAAQLALSDLALSKWLDAEIRLGEAVASSDPWVDSHRAALEKSRATAREKLGKIEIDGVPADATVEVTGRPPTKLPADGAIWVNPGTVHVKVTAPAFQAGAQDVIVAEKGSARVHMTLARVESESDGAKTGAALVTDAAKGDKGNTVAQGDHGDADHAHGTSTDVVAVAGGDTSSPAHDHRGPHSQLRVGSIAAAGIGVAAGITGLVLRNSASTKRAAIKSDGENGRPYNPDNGNYQTYDRLGVGLLVGGGVAVIGGVVGFILSLDDSEPAAERKTVMLGPGPGTFGLGLSGVY